MLRNSLLTENQLDEWVRSHARDAQGVIVGLVYRLVAAASPRPKERRFPLGDSIGQPGPDGILTTDFGFDPFVPEGRSFWEIGTGINAGDKATSDYRELTASIPELVRHESTFIFVTPLSGRRDWPNTWKDDAQAIWLKKRREHHEWLDVRVIDGSGLIDWLRHFPAVEHWLAEIMGFPARHLQTPEQCWAELRTIGAPPPLTPHVFLANRQTACERLSEIFSGKSIQLQLDTHFPDQSADFVTAYIASLDEETRLDSIGRCLVISNHEAWSAISILREQHVLIADFELDESDATATRLLERARRSGHRVIFASRPGGIPHPNRIDIPNPKSEQLKAALEQAGYNEERARILAQKSGGNLSSLLRCLQNLSLMPEWAQNTDAAELAIAELLGGWRDASEADRTIAERLSGNSYGEWIGTMRDIALSSGTPLTQQDGTWKVTARYEGWYALGPRLFDEHLERFREVAVQVLHERDPQFDQPPEDRYKADLYNKVLIHSRVLRKGLAESLALFGSHPKALTSCSLGKAEETAILAVREILADDDWVQWASLNDCLPLLAEAAPVEFLDAVERALIPNPSPFDTLFTQERGGVTGHTYMTGLLWALETLAWDSAYFTRVVLLLGELAAKDPGGSWANRPASSLSTILLPWLPQTCASIPKRQAAITTLQREYPDVAWHLLLTLLPATYQMSMRSRRPAWRSIIPDEWTDGVILQVYLEQITGYADLTIRAAQQDPSKLTALIARFGDLPPPAQDQLLVHLRSDTVTSMPRADRLKVWTQLVDLVAQHRKFANAKWAMKSETLQAIAEVAEQLTPNEPQDRHQRLFSERDHDLYEQKGNFQEQEQMLEARRQNAVTEVFAAGGVEALLELAMTAEAPWRVGVSFGTIGTDVSDAAILPSLLESQTKALTQFAGGFIWGRFRWKGWQWVDSLAVSQWAASQIGQLFAYLPFTEDTWIRVTQYLVSDDESAYWSKANVNPYHATDGLAFAIDRLVNYGRVSAAVRCLERLIHGKLSLDSGQAIQVLHAVLRESQNAQTMDEQAIITIITALQDDPMIAPTEMLPIEWSFLSLLDHHRGARPQFLEQRLADDPAFFREVIRAIFRSKHRDRVSEELSPQQESLATNGYLLLNNWRTPPGMQRDGSYNGGALAPWLEYVKASSKESGHLEEALSMAGRVLIFVPPDPGGLWLHHAAAAALDAKDADALRHGFQIGLFNRWGVYWINESAVGKEERELAQRYRSQADEIELQGYLRLASSLQDLATSYEREAEREESRARSDDESV